MSSMIKDNRARMSHLFQRIGTDMLELLKAKFSAAIGTIGGPSGADPAVRPATDAKFGDYQCSAAMALAKPLGLKPREVAERLVAAVTPQLSAIADPLEIAGPGFINIRLRTAYLAQQMERIPACPTDAAADRIGLPLTTEPQTVVVDYSSPNIAKQMHVGHLRSTIIGDVFARLLSFQGHNVIRQNHIGDWGTGIGMVILGLWYISSRIQRGETAADIERRTAELQSLKNQPEESRRPVLERIAAEWTDDLNNRALDGFADAEISLEQLELGYIFVHSLIAAVGALVIRVAGDDLAGVPQKVTKMLQKGGDENEPERKAWERARAISVGYCQKLYARLGVLLSENDYRGESAYNDDLPRVLTDLKLALKPADKSVPCGHEYADIRQDQGAWCVYLHNKDHSPRFKNPEGNELPLMVQKSDGAYLYATTDLAAIRYRVNKLNAGRILYVVGAPTKLHLEMVFATARIAGWAPPAVALEHVSFGQVLGEDRKLLRTRSGGAVKLGDLLDEAERRALLVLEEKLAQEDDVRRSSLSDEEKRQIAHSIGMGAVKYFDLARDRNSDYVFNWDSMLALQGNTAVYLLYAYARIRSIYRNAATVAGTADVYSADVKIGLSEPAERALALRLLRFGDSLEAVADDLMPHVLCGYLYDLAGEFMRFYESCPVKQAPDAAIRAGRMRLCDLTARTLRVGLQLLGIRVVERM